MLNKTLLRTNYSSESKLQSGICFSAKHPLSISSNIYFPVFNHCEIIFLYLAILKYIVMLIMLQVITKLELSIDTAGLKHGLCYGLNSE